MNLKKKTYYDVYDSNTNQWLNCLLIDKYTLKKKTMDKNKFIKIYTMPTNYLKKAFTMTKRIKYKVGDIVQLKVTNLHDEYIYKFKKINNQLMTNYFYIGFTSFHEDIWVKALIIKKVGKFISLLYVFRNDLYYIKILKDSFNIIPIHNNNNLIFIENIFHYYYYHFAKKKHMFQILKNILLKNIYDHEIIICYMKNEFIIKIILDNIFFFQHESQISFLKQIIQFSNNKTFIQKAYFELAHLYIYLNFDKKIIFNYLIQSGNTSVAIKYIKNDVSLIIDKDDPIDILYDLLISNT